MNSELHILPSESSESRMLTFRLLIEGKEISLHEMKQKMKWDSSCTDMVVRCERLYQQQIGHRYFDEKQKGPLHITAKESVSFLKAVASHVGLYFHNKRMIPNFFSPLTVVYRFVPKDAYSCLLEVFVDTGKQRYPLKECWIFPGSPCWCLIDGVLRVFHEDLAYQWLKPAAHNLSAEDKKKLEIELRDWKDEGLVIETSDIQLKNAPSEPLLKLQDAYGLHAKLFLLKSGNVVPYTKLEGEVFEQDLIEAGYTLQPFQQGSYQCPPNRVIDVLKLLIEVGWSVQDHKGRFIEIPVKAHLNMMTHSDKIHVSGGVEFKDRTMSLKDLRPVLIGAHTSFIELSPHKVGLISFKDTWKDIASSSKNDGLDWVLEKSYFGSLKSIEDQGDIHFDNSSRELLKGLDHKFDRQIAVQLLPEPVRVLLRDYQQQGIAWLMFLYNQGFHGLLADDMGLGKTLQVLSFLYQKSGEGWHLVIVPSSLLFHWEREVKKYFPELRVHFYYGTQRVVPEEGTGIVLTTYQILQRDKEKLQSTCFHCICLDESQRIKNPLSKTYQAAIGLKGIFRLAISGTPIENKLTDLWAQLHFLMPQTFLAEDFQKINHMGYSKEQLLLLKKQVAPFILRREKKQVAKELPPLLHEEVWLDFSSEEQVIYQDLLSKKKQEILQKIRQDGFNKHKMEIFELILRLRQLCCHPFLVSTYVQNDVSSCKGSKLELVVDEILQLLQQGSKVILFSQFVTMLNLIDKELSNVKSCVLRLDGQTKDRERVVDTFQNSKEAHVLLCSLKVGGVGLNLTAADYLLIYEPWWNEAVEQQAIDRAHRLGRYGQVIAKRYLYRSSIEEKIHELKKSKLYLFETIFEGNDHSLGYQEIEYLLSS